MRFSDVAAAVAFAGLANAQSQCLSQAEAIPACALGYIASFAYSSLSCGLVDFACQCSGTESIEVGIATVLPSGCNVGSVLNSANALCSCATANAPSSVTLNSIESSCQSLAADIPACALGYVAEAGYSIASCNLNDFACLCSNTAAIEGAVASNVQAACGSATPINSILGSAAALCSCVGAGSGGSSGTSAAASTTGASSAAPTGGSSSAAPTGSSAPSMTGSAMGSSGTSPATTGGSGSSGSGSSMSAPQQSASNSVPLFTNAGAKATALGGAMGALAGLVALL